MKIWIVLMMLWLGVASAAEPQRNLDIASVSGKKRVALVIGNAAYPGAGALRNPANDARDFAAKLKKLGFDVTVRTDMRYREMLRALTDFGGKVHTGNEVLFFYAGHGMQVRGRNYLIPIDAEIRGENSVSSEAVDVDQLLDKLSPARLSIVILDACRNNPFERRFRGGGQGLAQINAPNGTLIAYATAPGKVAADGEGRNGLYTGELLAAMGVPDIKIEDVFKRVRGNVVKKSGDAQTPWESSSLTGDFYFRGGESGGIAPAAPSSPQLNSPALELAFWESVDRGNSIVDYRTYLNKYPDGQFAELAHNRIGRLSGGVQVANAVPATLHDHNAPVSAPALPSIGDFWRYRGSNQNGSDAPMYKVAAVRGDRFEIHYVSNINEQMTLVLNADWNPISQLGQRNAEAIKFEPFAPNFQFPLEPGKKWRGQYKGECGPTCSFDVDYEYEVRGWETIAVPAGKFEALRIDSKDNYRHLFGMTSTGKRSAWFVPEIRHPVKFEYFYNGKRLHEYELESYQIAK